jgi:hypothetical protein
MANAAKRDEEGVDRSHWLEKMLQKLNTKMWF